MEGPILNLPETKFNLPPRENSSDQPPMSAFEMHLRKWDLSYSAQHLASSINDGSPSNQISPQPSVPEVTTASSGIRPTDCSPTTINSPGLVTNPAPVSETEPPQPSNQWGTAFRVRWIQVRGLPFHSTRMLRNPWNKDREVKVSRDGTELEPNVGHALLEFWEATTGMGATTPVNPQHNPHQQRHSLHRQLPPA